MVQPLPDAQGHPAIRRAVDGAYLAANMTKVPDGGWFPLLIGFIVFTLLTTWSRGRRLVQDRLREAAMPIPVFVASAANSAVRVPGTAVFMTSTPDGVPHALLHNLKSRFRQGVIYTSAGNRVLISLNPNRPLPHEYGEAQMADRLVAAHTHANAARFFGLTDAG